MGRGKKRRMRAKLSLAEEGNQYKETNEKGVRKNYADIVKENANFETYYKLQKICPEEEWSTFMDILKTSLPTTFRITASRSQARALLYILKENLIRDAVMAGKTDEELTIQPLQLPWYPDNLAWQLNLTRKDIRRNESYYRLHNFLISETANGNISRQEAVSMIPPLALQIEPQHRVLDMCAAPGSKTAQIIEVIQENDGKESEGLLIANDMDNKRCYMLVHQAKRLQSPCFIITNHDAAAFPDLYLTGKDGTSKERLEFDRVLCDVPCSGDGTIRKNVDIWRKWSPANGVFLHHVQYEILKRGLELLKVGGYLVYSTCSLNPIENEAVIHRMLRDCKGTLSLMDINLPNLKHSKGFTHWIPCSKDLVGYNSFEEVPLKWKTYIRDYIFPPSKEDAPKYDLEKCIRVLAHQQNTGNFFIALLKKTGVLPWAKTTTIEGTSSENKSTNGNDSSKEAGASTPVVDNRTQNTFTVASKMKKLRGYKEDPFVFITEDDPIWAPLKEFYTLDTSLNSANFLTRSLEGKKRNIYFVSDLVKDLVVNNIHSAKIVNTGVKVLARCGQKWCASDFRLAQEGLKAMLPYVHGRRVQITREDLITLLSNEDDNRPPLLETLSPDAQIQLESLDRGSCVLHIKSKVEKDGPEFSLDLVGWRGNASLRAYVPKPERMHYLRLCGGDISKYETNKFQEAKNTASDPSQKMEEGIDDGEDEANGCEDDDAAVVTNSPVAVENE